MSQPVRCLLLLLFLGTSCIAMRKKATHFVVLEGTVSTKPEQHLIDATRATEAVYFDLAGGGQIVVYVQGGLPEGVPLRLEGTWLDATGPSKRPGASEQFSETQFDVASWTTIDGSSLPSAGP